MTRLRGLDHVQLAMPAGGETAARPFYGGLLGLREVSKPAALDARGGCSFVGPGINLHLGGETDFHPAHRAHVAFVVDDLDQLRSRLAEGGVRIVEDKSGLRVSRFYAFDPFGNRIEFVAARDAGFTLRTAW